MKKYEAKVKELYDLKLLEFCHKYSNAGRSYRINNENFYGIYWLYETDSYVLDITDVYVKKDAVVHEKFNDGEISIISNYIINGEGAWIEPYQCLSSNSIFLIKTEIKSPHYIIYGQRPLLCVGIKFKKKYINSILEKNANLNEKKLYKLIFETREIITKRVNDISKEILSNSLTKEEIDEKVKEWFELSMKTYETNNEIKMAEYDEKAIQNVGYYIQENYNKQITQKLLENIALMSGTKLKNKFKEKFNMSITEYIQRKRINVAENLILKTNLSLANIAKNVGYNSNSRFSLLFKRYKGINPNKVKELKTKAACLSCPMYKICKGR